MSLTRLVATVVVLLSGTAFAVGAYLDVQRGTAPPSRNAGTILELGPLQSMSRPIRSGRPLDAGLSRSGAPSRRGAGVGLADPMPGPRPDAMPNGMKAVWDGSGVGAEEAAWTGVGATPGPGAAH